MTGTAARTARRRGAGRAVVRELVVPFRLVASNPALTALLAGFSGLTFAEWGYVTALAIDAYRLGGAFAVGLVGLRLLVGAAATFAAVPFVERHAGRQLLTAIAGLRAAIVLATAGLAASGAPLAPLLALVMVDAVVAAPYRLAQAARLTSAARTPAELAASAAGLSTVKTLSQATGAAVGGSLLVVTTPQWVFLGAAVLFALVAAAAAQRQGPRLRPAPREGGARRLTGETVRVIRNGHVTGIVVVSGLRSLVRGMWVALAVIVSLRLLHAGSGGVALLMLAAGAGTLTAVPLSSMLIGRSRIGTPTALALIACGLPLALVAGIPLLDVAVLLVVAWGVGMAVADVGASALLYRLLDTPHLPRVIGVMEAAKLALEGCGAFLAPALASAFGARVALVIAAVPLPMVVAAGWRTLHRVDESASERHRVLRFLHAVPCFAPLDVVALEYVASRAEPVKMAAGCDVVRQGDRGDRFFVIVDGGADVLVDGYLVGTLGPGDGFGEKALLRDVARTATVRTTAATELLAVARDDFLSVLADDRARGVGGDEPLAARTTRERADVLARVSLLSHLEPAALAALAETSIVDRWAEGAVVVREGEVGDRFYVVLDGRAAVAAAGEVVGELRPGDQFGEIALLHDVPRRADVIARTPLTTLSIRRADFLPAVGRRTDPS